MLQTAAVMLLLSMTFAGRNSALADVTPEQGKAVLDRYCIKCHGPAKVQSKLRLDTPAGFAAAGESGTPLLNKDKPEDSLLWKRVINRSMPPEGQPRPSAEENEQLKQWLASGAKYPPPLPPINRAYVGEEEVQSAILKHLGGIRESAQPFQRYLTFTNLHNHPNIPDRDLDLYKAATSKLLNSLTWQHETVVPQPIDLHKTVYVIDLRELGWTRKNHWEKLLKRYPYALEHDAPELVKTSKQVQKLAGESLAALRLRADWLVSRASHPPLYHELLELPDTLDGLTKKLEVSLTDNWLNADLMRGGVIRSGVASQNRLLDRHRSRHGSFWISYDFLSSGGKADLSTHPNGPIFDSNPFQETSAFKEDGGEIVFNLPNGLQGYLIIDAKGKRIDEAPLKVVSDPSQSSGSPAVVNGISCMACHKHGMREFQNEILPAATLTGAAREKALDLFASQGAMNQRLKQDRETFLRAVQQAVQPFLPAIATTDDVREKIVNEPIGALAGRYEADLDLTTIAAEMDIRSHKEIEIRADTDLRRLIGTALAGGVIKRSAWEALETGLPTRYHLTAQKLEKGSPKFP